MMLSSAVFIWRLDFFLKLFPTLDDQQHPLLVSKYPAAHSLICPFIRYTRLIAA